LHSTDIIRPINCPCKLTLKTEITCVFEWYEPTRLYSFIPQNGAAQWEPKFILHSCVQTEHHTVFIALEEKRNHRLNLHGVTLRQLHLHYDTKHLTVCTKQGSKKKYPEKFPSAKVDTAISTEAHLPNRFRLLFPVVLVATTSSWLLTYIDTISSLNPYTRTFCLGFRVLNLVSSDVVYTKGM
jgi:hypothetical protein